MFIDYFLYILNEITAVISWKIKEPEVYGVTKRVIIFMSIVCIEQEYNIKRVL